MDEFDGYFPDTPYPATHHIELEPEHLALAALSAGVPSPMTRPIRYLELGCGRGLSANIIAAAGNHEVWGVDLNQSHASEAAQLARDSGANVRIFGESFTEFLARDDVPEFDIVVLHGVWSWVSPEQRTAILEILKRHLVLGGLVYVSYNCLPGWAGRCQLPGFFSLHDEVMKGVGSMDGRFAAGLELLKKSAQLGAAHFKSNPQVLHYLEFLASGDPGSRAHEWLPRHWQAFFVHEVASAFKTARLDYVGQAHLRERTLIGHLPDALRQLIAEVSDPMLREVLLDFALNRMFRRDIYVRGGTRLLWTTRRALWSQAKFTLVRTPDDLSFEFDVPGGSIRLNPELTDPLVEFLSEDRVPRPLGELLARHKGFEETLIEALAALVGSGQIRPVQHEVLQRRARVAVAKLNAALVNRALARGDLGFLASPLTGGGVPVPRLHQLYLGVRATTETEDLRAVLHDYIVETGIHLESLEPEGETLQTEGEGSERIKGLADASINGFLARVSTYEALDLRIATSGAREDQACPQPQPQPSPRTPVQPSAASPSLGLGSPLRPPSASAGPPPAGPPLAPPKTK